MVKWRWIPILCLVGSLAGCRLAWLDTTPVGEAYTEDYNRMQAGYGEDEAGDPLTPDEIREAALAAIDGRQAASETSKEPSAADKAVAEAMDPDSIDWEYRIRPGDSLQIVIPYPTEKTYSVPVHPDGQISFLYDIQLMAAGKTYRELRDELRQQLAKYRKHPNVAVLGESFKGNTVFVLGAVGKPGSQVIQNDTRLLDVMAEAGVLTQASESVDRASGTASETGVVRVEAFLDERIDFDRAWVARRHPKLGDIKLRVDFKNLIQGEGLTKNNIRMRPGDVLFFPSYESVDQKKLFLVGDVSEQSVVYFRENATLLETIILAGGINQDTARQRGVYVLRKGLNKPILTDLYKIKQGKLPDVPLRDGDIVYVPERTLARVSGDMTTVMNEISAPLEALLSLHNNVRDTYQKEWTLHTLESLRRKQNNNNPQDPQIGD